MSVQLSSVVDSTFEFTNVARCVINGLFGCNGILFLLLHPSENRGASFSTLLQFETVFSPTLGKFLK